MDVRGGENGTDQRGGGNSAHERRAAVDARRENVLRRVDLRHSDQGHRISGQDAAVGPVTVQKATDVDAQPEPTSEADQKQPPRLEKDPADHNRAGHPTDVNYTP